MNVKKEDSTQNMKKFIRKLRICNKHHPFMLIFKPTAKTRDVKIIGLAMETLSTLLLVGQYDMPICKAIRKEIHALGFLRSGDSW